jgi:hypothetical protein
MTDQRQHRRGEENETTAEIERAAAISRIVSSVADRECNRVARKVIRSLQRMTDQTTSGDSRLQNVWDEVCVQVQISHSSLWFAYMATIRQLVEWNLAKLPLDVGRAIWLQTAEGEAWEPPLGGEEPPVVNGDIVEYVVATVLSMADYWTNARIEAYRATD